MVRDQIHADHRITSTLTTAMAGQTIGSHPGALINSTALAKDPC